MRFWPLAAGAIAVVLTWATGTIQLNSALDSIKDIKAEIRGLQSWKIKQLLKNRELEVQHAETKDYMNLIDSKYARQCK